MNTPTESAAQESERNRIAGVLRSIAAWMIGEKKGDHCNLKRGDAANDLLSAAALLLAPQPPITKDAPIDMVLYCPKCGMQHVDADESQELSIGGTLESGTVRIGWDNPPHRSHLCHGCGHVWRPSDHPTNGVARTVSGKDADTQPSKDAPVPAQDGVEEIRAKLAKFIADQKPTPAAIAKFVNEHTSELYDDGPPLQPTPSAQPVIGELYVKQMPGSPPYRAVILKLPDGGMPVVKTADTEAEALAFIKSCRTAQPNEAPAGEADRLALDAYAEKLGNVRYAWAAIREHIGSDVIAGGSFEKLINAMDAAIAQQKETAT